MESTIYIERLETEYSNLLLGEFKGKLCLCDWEFRKQRKQIDQRIQKGLCSDYEFKETAFLEEVKQQLNSYFKKELQEFNIPLLLVGTNFQKEVWSELQKIPYGETKSYAQLSLIMNNPKAIRAIASANGANALSIVVPCHRVVGSDGSLTGYAGGLQAKQKLLQLEGGMVSGQLELF